MLSRLKDKLKKYNLFRIIFSFISKFKKSFFLLMYRILARIQGKTIVHFLHIGKTGGTSIKYALKNDKKPFINEKYIIFSPAHAFTLKDSLPGEKVFFFVRDPIDRFISGFYFKKRKGMPKIYTEWKPAEKEAFETFNTPNELAISLSKKDENIRKIAIKSMKSIGHVKSSYWDWFGDEKYLLSRIQDIIFVGTQKNLDKDFIHLKKILNLPKNLELPKDNFNKHKSPENLDKYLNPKAVKNLTEWYSKEFQFLKLLEEKNLLQ